MKEGGKGPTISFFPNIHTKNLPRLPNVCVIPIITPRTSLKETLEVMTMLILFVRGMENAYEKASTRKKWK